MKKIIAAGMTVLMLLGTCLTSFAAPGWNRNDKGWWYEYEDGSSPKSSWKWISGRKYYFNENGYMLENRTAPDGKTVNSDGAWTVDSVVQEDNYDSNYPLRGMTTDVHLETNNRYDFLESGINGNTSVWAAYNDSCNRYEYLALYVDRLSGKTQDFGELHQSFPEQAIRSEATYQVMKAFLNSFDWRNASDKTKVEMAAKLVCQSSYLKSGSGIEHMVYGCLVNKKAVCDGFALSFTYLTRLMGMESAYIENGVHAFNIVKIDGSWYEFDATNSSLETGINTTTLGRIEVSISNGNINLDWSNYNINGADTIRFDVR